MDTILLKKQIGLKVKQMRVLKNWSREKIADKLHLSIAAYGSIERGETDLCITRLAQIAGIFEMTLTELLGLTDKNVFIQTQNQECSNLQINASNEKELLQIKHDLEKSYLIQQSQAKEIENLKQQIVQLQEIIALIKNS